ncbi:MAG: hypothetical protein K9W43_05065 [Candidatus Thorarchaeota archaeon]|nr:hypothetical protein [Candidatus Thorarchaeota archaeon]
MMRAILARLRHRPFERLILSSETRLQFLLTLRLTFKSVFNRKYGLRLVVLFTILLLMTITTTRFYAHYQTTLDVFFMFVAQYTQFSYYVLYTVIPVTGMLFSSKAFRAQVPTLTSHPVSKKMLFVSRILVVVTVTAVFQAVCGIAILIERWTLNGSGRLWTVEPSGIFSFLVPIMITSVIIGIVFTSVMTLIPLFFKKTSIAYVLNLFLLWSWDGLAGICLLDGLYNKQIIFAPVSPAALTRNLFVQMMYPGQIPISVVEGHFGFQFTPAFLLVQIVVTVLQVGLCLYIGWRLFDHKSRTW